MMAINALPATNTVPVGVKAGVTGEFTITATETSEFADVILEDLLTGTITDLKSKAYTFSYDMNWITGLSFIYADGCFRKSS